MGLPPLGAVQVYRLAGAQAIDWQPRRAEAGSGAGAVKEAGLAGRSNDFKTAESVAKGVLAVRWAGLLAAVAFALTAWAQEPTRPVLDNGGFERGSEGWKLAAGHKVLDDPSAAHSGRRCLFGQVREPNKALIAKITLPMRRNAIYRFVAWARATGRTKLVLWRRTAGKRLYVQAWQNLPRRWRKCEVVFSVEADGPTVLEVVAPSSFGAPPGSIWLDDVQVYESLLPPGLDLPDSGFCDSPVAMRAGEDSAWIAWISFADGRDRLKVALINAASGRPRVAGIWCASTDNHRYILGPALASDGRETWLLYSAEVGGNWDIYAVRLGSNGPSKPLRLTNSPAMDRNPAGAALGGELCVVWESNRGGWHRIWAGRLTNRGLVGVAPVSSAGHNNYKPAAASDGRVMWVVWHSFRGGNWDLWGRKLSGAKWGREVRLTRAPAIDRDAAIVAGRGEFWLAWEWANCRDYHVGAAAEKRVQVALLRNGRLFSPRGLDQTGLWGRAEAPCVAVDGCGRVWVSARVPRGQHAGWSACAWVFGPDGARGPWHLAGQKGMCRTIPILPLSRGCLAAVQWDDIPNRWDSAAESATASSRVAVRLVGASGRGGHPELSELREPEEPFSAAPTRARFGEDRRGWIVTYRGCRLCLLFGDLHEHSDISVCNRTGDETQDQTWQMMRDLVRYDFGAITDHGYNFNAYLWHRQAKLVRANYDPGRFVTFLAQEWTSTFERYSDKYPYGYYGHRNLILRDPYFPRWFNAWEGTRPDELWRELRELGADFILIPHQLADTGNVPMAWEFHDPSAQPVVEIFQVRGSYEYKGCPRQAGRTTPKGWFFQDALARGIIAGVIAAPDHAGGIGKACVYAEGLNRGAIFSAIRQRRTYGTTGAKIFLDVRINGHFMGEVVHQPPSGPVRIEVRADCPGELQAVDVWRSNILVHSVPLGGRRCDLVLWDEPPAGRPCFYYVRLRQRDGEMAWSSPVWFGRSAQ